MKLRPPALPLITVDPYFSVWSMSDRLTDKNPCHWTGKPNTILGTAVIDGVEYRFLGEGDTPCMKQASVEVEAFSTTVRMEAAGVALNLVFLTPLLPHDYEHLTRPVSYLQVQAESIDGEKHDVAVSVQASEELCLNEKGEMEVCAELLTLNGGIPAAKMGSKDQPVLAKSGDDIRINWGYFYLAAKGNAAKTELVTNDMHWLKASADLSSPALFAFAYDDVQSIEYFGNRLVSWWNRNGKSIETAILEAFADFEMIQKECAAFSERLFCDAVRAGGEKYAEILLLSCRQLLAAHKLVLDENGEILYISKECFSNGCAATVDVSYPSIPFFLIYNPELIKGMMRPIFKYAASEAWPFDFAPHDVGQYPLLNGQAYGWGKLLLKDQMPVEECGNMLLMMAAVCAVEKDASFAAAHLDTLRQWAKYLLENGTDPDNQLCTDDFAGHLAHNCNLSLKAIMGLAGLGRIFSMLGNPEEAGTYTNAAKEMAATWVRTAANGDGSFRLAFDQPGTFSMKYNAVWDKVMGLGIFAPEIMASEFASYRKHINPYGMPLDNRETYTKSDWLVWCATLANDKEDFEHFVAPLWNAYHYSPSRVPMTDWYQTTTSLQVGFQHRTVQGGLYMKLLDFYGICR